MPSSFAVAVTSPSLTVDMLAPVFEVAENDAADELIVQVILSSLVQLSVLRMNEYVVPFNRWNDE